MKHILVVCAFFAAGQSWADPRDDINDKSKAVWSDFTINLFYFFIENIPFNSFSQTLCVFDMTRYWEHTNFMESLEGEPQAYAVSLDYNLCGESDTTMQSVVLATQEAPSSPTKIDYWKSSNPNSKTDYRRSAQIDEEPTSANPLGIVDLNTELVDKASNTMLAKVRHQSVRNDEGLIEQFSVIYIDATISGFADYIGQAEEYYSSRIIRTSANTGYGTIAFKDFRNHGYPEGSPPGYVVMDIAFDAARFRSQTVGGVQRCIAREGSWLSIRENGYGVYDELGERFRGTATASYVAADGSIVPLTIWGPNTVFAGQTNCRSLKDGSLSSSCPVSSAQYFRDPVPDLTVATEAGTGQKFIIRQLKPQTVQPLLESSACDDLFFQRTLVLKDSNYLEEVALNKPIASSGAIMVNNYGTQGARDLIYQGNSYVPNGDPDGDGIPNYLDAYPEDSSSDYDKDYDGVKDSNDATDDRFVFDHSTFFTPNAVEVLVPGMAKPAPAAPVDSPTPNTATPGTLADSE